MINISRLKIYKSTETMTPVLEMETHFLANLLIKTVLQLRDIRSIWKINIYPENIQIHLLNVFL